MNTDKEQCLSNALAITIAVAIPFYSNVSAVWKIVTGIAIVFINHVQSGLAPVI